MLQTNWFLFKVNIHTTGQRIGDNKRRRRQVICARQRMDPALKVAVARQNGRSHQIVLTKLGIFVRKLVFGSFKKKSNSTASMACETGSGRGPLLPMQVMQP